MESTNFDFWKMAFDMKAIDSSILRQAVVCKTNPYGEVTLNEFKEICGEDFEKKVISEDGSTIVSTNISINATPSI